MKTAFIIWDGRIAPVFDIAREVCLVEFTGGQSVAEKMLALPLQAVAWLQGQRVDRVVCGAISRLLQEQLVAAGITVAPFVAGELRQVIEASLNGTLSDAAFAMPGCCGRRRMRRQRGAGHCCAARRSI